MTHLRGQLAIKDDAGFSLIEYLVALTILSLLSTMVMISLSTMETVSGNSYERGNATYAAILAADTLTSAVQSAVSPSTVAQVAGSDSGICGTTPCSGSLPYATSSGPCWGTASTLDANLPPNLASPAETWILSASNYSIEFCGYPNGPRKAAPQVILIQPNTNACNHSDPNVPTCPLVEYDLGSGYPLSTPSSSNAVATVNRVWCDSYCQGTVATPGDTPAFFSYCATPVSIGVSAACNATPWSDMSSPPATTSAQCSDSPVRIPTPLTLLLANTTSNPSQCLPQISSVTIDITVFPNRFSINTPSPATGSGIGSDVIKQIPIANN